MTRTAMGMDRTGIDMDCTDKDMCKPEMDKDMDRACVKRASTEMDIDWTVKTLLSEIVGLIPVEGVDG
jgi:hypothetical protein